MVIATKSSIASSERSEARGRARTVAIVGVGLIGGSLARDLAAVGWRVLGHDRDADTIDAAIRSGVVHGAFPESGPIEADVAVLAVPVSSFAPVLRGMASRIGGVPLIMDVCSTKRSTVAAAQSLGVGDRFVGAHPMAGSHRSGWNASRRGLFAGCAVYLCPTPLTSSIALDSARELWETLGGRVEAIAADVHDALVAQTSHLPQLVSYALGLALAQSGVSRSTLGPGGQDVTRLAASDVEMWTSIMLDNGDAILQALSRHQYQMATLRAAIERRDARALRSELANAQRWARAIETIFDEVTNGPT
jgi:prephenate dehydrogenase